MPGYDPKVRQRIYYQQTAAFALILIITAIGFVVLGRVQDQQCQTAYENRVAIRNLSTAIADLGRDLVLGSDDSETITSEQQATLDQFEQFKAEQIEALDLPVCPK